MRRPLAMLFTFLVPAFITLAADNPPHDIPDKAATRKQITDLIAEFQTSKSKATLGLLRHCIDLSISYGAPAWNEKDHEECLTFYRTTVQALVDAFPTDASATPLAAAAMGDLKNALARIKDLNDVEKSAWILRYAFDKTQLAVDVETSRAAELISLGSDYLARADFDDAEDACATALALLPEMRGLDRADIPMVWRVAPIASAHALLGQRKYHEAAAAIAQGLEAVPEWTSSKTDLRDLYGDPLVFDALVSDLKAQIRRAPDDATLPLLLGYTYFFSGDKEAAKPFLEKALSLDPKNSAAKILLNPPPPPRDPEGPTGPKKPQLQT